MPLSSVADYIQTHIDTFHQKRLEKLNGLKLAPILKRKNPYLFKAKNLLTAEGLVRSVLDAYLSSQEETLFGDFLEGVAVFVSHLVYGGYKPDDLEGIDLVFEDRDTLFVVEIKSGPHWGNFSQRSRMLTNFANAKALLQPRYPRHTLVAVNGCSYGQHTQYSQKDGAYYKLCGQDFWRFISGNDDLYLDLIEPLGHRANQRNDAFEEAYARIINRFTLEFGRDYCLPDGAIDWAKLVNLTSIRPANTVYPF